MWKDTLDEEYVPVSHFTDMHVEMTTKEAAKNFVELSKVNDPVFECHLQEKFANEETK